MSAMVRSRTIFIISAAACAAFAVFYADTDVGYTALYAVAMLCALAAVQCLMLRLSIKTYSSVSKTIAAKNEPLTYESLVVNRLPLPYVRLKLTHSGLKCANIISVYGADESYAVLPARGRVRRLYELSFPYRGCYTLGADSVAAFDFLGIFRRTAGFNAKGGETVVYPGYADGVELSFLLSSRSCMNRAFEDPDREDRDLRKYRPEDDLRKVHWKLSAKRSELIIREFETVRNAAVPVILDTLSLPGGERERAALEDRLVSYAATVIKLCAGRLRPVEFIFGTCKHERLNIAPRDGAESVLGLLARLEFGRAGSELPGILSHYRASSEPLDIVVLLYHIDEAVFRSLAHVAASGHSLTVFRLNLNGGGDDWDARLLRLGAEVTAIAPGEVSA